LEVSTTRRLIAAVAVPALLGAAAACGSTSAPAVGTLAHPPHRITGTSGDDTLTGTTRPNVTVRNCEAITTTPIN
jgi:hypothetical protein